MGAGAGDLPLRIREGQQHTLGLNQIPKRTVIGPQHADPHEYVHPGWAARFGVRGEGGWCTPVTGKTAGIVPTMTVTTADTYVVCIQCQACPGTHTHARNALRTF